MANKEKKTARHARPGASQPPQASAPPAANVPPAAPADAAVARLPSGGRLYRLSLEQLRAVCEQYEPHRRIESIHLHASWRPAHRDYAGAATLAAIARFHTDQWGFAAIAQHMTIAPDGTVWTGRSWESPPASVSGFNGNAKAGPLMIMLIGDFTDADTLAGPQRDALVGVVALLQDRWNLPTDALKAAWDLGPSAPPAGAIDLADLHAAIEQAKAAPAVPAAPAALFAANALRNIPPDLLNDLRGPAPEPAEPADAEPKPLTLTHDQVVLLSGRPDLSSASAAPTSVSRDGLSSDQLAGLRGHLINMTAGRFERDELPRMGPADVAAIFNESLPHWRAANPNGPLRVVLYAHGGLVDRKSGLAIAQKHADWWKANGVYPIYFIWETGLASTVKGLFTGRLSRDLLPLSPSRDFADVTDRVLEGVARAARGVQIWDGMKRSAELAFRPSGPVDKFAGDVFLNQLKAFADRQGVTLELHGVGHSAGSIFFSYLLQAALRLGVPTLKSLHLLAPAVRVDEFKSRLLKNGQLLGTDALSVYTMRQDYELDDNCASVYRKSLLYLIYYALEAQRKTPILGLEECLRDDTDLAGLFDFSGNPAAKASVVWSLSAAGSGRSASQSTSHGGFDDDPATMNSVLRRIKNLGDTDPIVNYAENGVVGRALAAASAGDTAADRLLPGGPVISRGGAFVPGLPGGPVISRDVAYVPGLPGGVIVPRYASGLPGGPWVQRATGGRRAALCVGINDYPDPYRLQGCVPDAQLWAQSLANLGFQSHLLLNAEATRDGILGALKSMIAEAAPGDVIAFQYSGHGTSLPDLDGDEAGTDSPDTDEAIVPFDFNDGRYVIDDDLALLFAGIPDGVNLTCFIDCCHSGTITRLALGPSAGTGGGRRRFMPASVAMVASHVNFRRRTGLIGRAMAGRRAGDTPLREILFSACNSKQSAWESNGQGDFTRLATTILGRGIDNLTNAAFQGAVNDAFGPSPRQNPELSCAPSARDQGLLQPLGPIAPGTGGPPRPDTPAGPIDRQALVNLIKLLTDLL